MATEQLLKKKLRGVRSIQKVSKALKTASAVKFSRLTSLHSSYSEYSLSYQRLYEDNRALFDHRFAVTDDSAPRCVVVMAGNKGMCGSFNSDLLAFASEYIKEHPTAKILLCGKKTESYFEDFGLKYDKAFGVSDIPTYEESAALSRYIFNLLSNGEISTLEIIYPEYLNMLKQEPTRIVLLTPGVAHHVDRLPLFFPDRRTVVEALADKVLASVIHGKVIECALGAQAATLLTMRSSYDTATEYSEELSAEINRIRQSRVTADVLDTSTEFSNEVGQYE